LITNREQDPDDWGIVKAQGSSDDDPPLDPKECNVNIPTLNDAIPLIALCRKSEVVNIEKLLLVVNGILKRGCKVNHRSSDGMSSILWAVLNDNVPLARVLLSNGAAPDTVDSLKIPLIEHCKSGSMRFLVKTALETTLKEV
jgi:ankyrin repeat protein